MSVLLSGLPMEGDSFRAECSRSSQRDLVSKNPELAKGKRASLHDVGPDAVESDSKIEVIGKSDRDANACK